MSNCKRLIIKVWLPTLFVALSLAALLTVLTAGCASDSGGVTGVCDRIPPSVISSVPADSAVRVSVSSNITATFSEEMNPEKINNATMILDQAGIQVAGAVSYVGLTATFDPTVNLASSTVYTATITTGAEDLTANALEVNYIWTFTTADVTPPTVISTVPIDRSNRVLVESNVTALFSEVMDSLTVTSSTMMIKQGVVSIAGVVSYSGVTATFDPTNALASATTYTAVITTRAKDVAGNALESNYVWTFTTADIVPPTVISTVPIDSSYRVSVESSITGLFSEIMDSLTITSATMVLRQGGVSIAGVVSYSGVTATFDPTNTLASATTYTATITTGAEDVAGNPMTANYVWTFTTADMTAPSVVSTVPVDGATGVAININVTATFSEAMDAGTISDQTMTLTEGGNPVAGAVSYAAGVATFNPTNDLSPFTVYTATITTGAEDVAGNPLASNYVWTFTTGLAPLNLRTASTFAVLGGSTVTNTGGTVVNGDLGVSPGAAITGFPPGVVNGNVHSADAEADQAKTDLTDAYNEAVGLNTNPVEVAGDLGGQTLTPGLYFSTSTLEISAGNLTLDAQGNADAIWIFQIATTLTTTDGRQVVLSDSANAGNIFWQVGTSATLGTNSVFKGTILADQSITVTTGATVDGRVLARNAAVTLDTNTITVP